ncbi:tryptophan synthase subunit alpha [Blattabacterium cuenoti]|uniref:tryptophan synthase subunit alpha n=1 Tax=Blattabacterium cuenoti TaxID=1653831 RepID=UPI00163D1CF0|nr:tryptophan synthase subunit alpha [Blattabacterium cuenoti]
MNQIHKLFQSKKRRIFCVYFTAGYPTLNSMEEILHVLQSTPVDLIEIGLPYSDPLSDGVVIQNSSRIALKNGMNISLLFSIIEKIKKKIRTPIILMGYYNQFYKFGEEKFLKESQKSGVSGLIFPDLSVDIYVKKYEKMFKKYFISMIFLITPKTDMSRIIYLSKITDGFLYVVSSNSITGKHTLFKKEHFTFFTKIKRISNIPKLIGFGIQNKNDFDFACKYANGGIIGSSFIQSINKNRLKSSIIEYIETILM